MASREVVAPPTRLASWLCVAKLDKSAWHHTELLKDPFSSDCLLELSECE